MAGSYGMTRGGVLCRFSQAASRKRFHMLRIAQIPHSTWSPPGSSDREIDEIADEPQIAMVRRPPVCRLDVALDTRAGHGIERLRVLARRARNGSERPQCG
jgi:hypothetical protein